MVFLNLVCTHLPWLTSISKEAEAREPTDVCLLGADVVHLAAYGIAYAMEQFPPTR